MDAQLGADVQAAMLVEWLMRRLWRGSRGPEGQRERKMLWSRRASGLSSSSSLGGGDELESPARRERSWTKGS